MPESNKCERKKILMIYIIRGNGSHFYLPYHAEWVPPVTMGSFWACKHSIPFFAGNDVHLLTIELAKRISFFLCRNAISSNKTWLKTKVASFRCSFEFNFMTFLREKHHLRIENGATVWLTLQYAVKNDTWLNKWILRGKYFYFEPANSRFCRF